MNSATATSGNPNGEGKRPLWKHPVAIWLLGVAGLFGTAFLSAAVTNHFNWIEFREHNQADFYRERIDLLEADLNELKTVWPDFTGEATSSGDVIEDRRKAVLAVLRKMQSNAHTISVSLTGDEQAVAKSHEAALVKLYEAAISARKIAESQPMQQAMHDWLVKREDLLELLLKRSTISS